MQGFGFGFPEGGRAGGLAPAGGMRKPFLIAALGLFLLTGCGSGGSPGLATGEGTKPVHLSAQQSGWRLSGGFRPYPGIPVSGKRETVYFTLQPPSGGQVTGPVTLRFEMADMLMGIRTVTAQPVGGGSYRVPITFSMDGPWQATVDIPANSGAVEMVIPFVVH